MITKTEIKNFWIDYWCLMLNWTSFSILGFFSTAVIWAHILRDIFKVKRKFLLLNYTKDGDFGDPNIMLEKGFGYKENTPKFFKWWIRHCGAFYWWIRNHSWEFITRFIPEWKAGEVDKDENGKELFKTIKSTIDLSGKKGRFSRAGKENKGVHYIAYVINGRTYAQYSKANWLYTLELGTGGDRYRFIFKLNII